MIHYVDKFTNFVDTCELLPRIGLRCFQGKTDSLFVQVDIEHLDRHFVADIHDRRRMVDVLPRELLETWTSPSIPPRSTKAPKLTTEETTPFRISPGFRFSKNSPRLFFLGLFEAGATGKNNVVSVLVELDDLCFQRPSDIGLQIAHPTKLDERRRKKATKTDIQDQWPPLAIRN